MTTSEIVNKPECSLLSRIHLNQHEKGQSLMFDIITEEDKIKSDSQQTIDSVSNFSQIQKHDAKHTEIILNNLDKVSLDSKNVHKKMSSIFDTQENSTYTKCSNNVNILSFNLREEVLTENKIGGPFFSQPENFQDTPFKAFHSTSDSKISRLYEDLDKSMDLSKSCISDQRQSIASCCESFQTEWSQNSKIGLESSQLVPSFPLASARPDNAAVSDSDFQNIFLNVPPATYGTSRKSTIASMSSYPSGTSTQSIMSSETTHFNEACRNFELSPSELQTTTKTLSQTFLGNDEFNSKEKSFFISPDNLPLTKQHSTQINNSCPIREFHVVESNDNVNKNSKNIFENLCEYKKVTVLNNGISHFDDVLWKDNVNYAFEQEDDEKKSGWNEKEINRSGVQVLPEYLHTSFLEETIVDTRNEMKTSTKKKSISDSPIDICKVKANNIGSEVCYHSLLAVQDLNKALDINFLSYTSRRWQNLNVVLPLFIPHGIVAILRTIGENTYVFSDKYPASQLLFSGAGKICDMWSTYLRLRVAVIHKCPEFMVPRVAQVFNEKLATLPKFASPIHLHCSGIVKHTIQLRSSGGLTYRYDTIGQFRDGDDKKKMQLLFCALQGVLNEVNTTVAKEADEILKKLQIWEAERARESASNFPCDSEETNDLRHYVFDVCNKWTSNEYTTNSFHKNFKSPSMSPSFDTRSIPKCELEFRFSPCKELKIPIREGSLCECAGVDSLVAGGGASSMSSWAQQFSVDNLILGEIRLERDKTSETQLDPFFLPENEVRTRLISKDIKKNPARVCFVDPSVYPSQYRPPVEYSLNSSPFEAAEKLCGATHYTLAQLLPRGLTSILPNSLYYNTLYQSNYGINSSSKFGWFPTNPSQNNCLWSRKLDQGFSHENMTGSPGNLSHYLPLIYSEVDGVSVKKDYLREELNAKLSVKHKDLILSSSTISEHADIVNRESLSSEKSAKKNNIQASNFAKFQNCFNNTLAESRFRNSSLSHSTALHKDKSKMEDHFKKFKEIPKIFNFHEMFSHSLDNVAANDVETKTNRNQLKCVLDSGIKKIPDAIDSHVENINSVNSFLHPCNEMDADMASAMSISKLNKEKSDLDITDNILNNCRNKEINMTIPGFSNQPSRIFSTQHACSETVFDKTVIEETEKTRESDKMKDADIYISLGPPYNKYQEVSLNDQYATNAHSNYASTQLSRNHKSA